MNPQMPPSVAVHAVGVVETWTPSPRTRASRVERPAGLEFLASQSVRLDLGGDLVRPMSIASGPARPYLDFAVQRSESAFKAAFFGLSPGDVVRVATPRGPFLLDRARPAIMVASGIGITPFRSMLHALTDEHATLAGALVHATRGPMDVPFREEIDALTVGAGLRLVRRSGPVPDDLLRELAEEFAAPVWYVAGPVEDLRDVAERLLAMGVDRADLRLEAFRYPGSLAAPGAPGGFPDWEQLYRSTPGERMARYVPGLDPDVAAAIDAHALRGRALDVGTGPGTQAIALAERGFEVTGADISAAAVETAQRRGGASGARFVVDDVLASKLGGEFDVVLDRGCFHVLPASRRGDYANAIAARLPPGGTLLLKCFADDQPGEGGPARFSSDEIRSVFADRFDVVSVSRTVYQGTLDPPPRALFCVLHRRPNGGTS